MNVRKTGSTAGWFPGDAGPAEPARAVATLPQPGQLLGGRFLLRRQLGAGGSGVVFAAHDEQVGQAVAVKVLFPHLVDSSARERLRREVQAARLGHPNLVAVHDLHQTDGLLYLSMELVDGESLRDLLARGVPLGVTEAVKVAREVASALVHLHAAGIVHRDVKPGNVMLAADGRTRLCDLGLARPAGQGVTVTASVLTVGTPAYMAPEQGIGDRLSPAADVYSLGLTLYEALTGEVPDVGETPLATALNRQRRRPPRLRRALPNCPRWLDRLVDRMLERDPRRRPPASEVEHGLATGRVRRRPPWRVLAAAALAVAAIFVAVAGWRALRRGATVRVETVGHEVRGVDAHAGVTWSYRFDSPIRQVEHADLDGDGMEETIVAAFPDLTATTAEADLAMSEVLVVSSRGRVLSRAHPEELTTAWRHPFSKRFVLGLGLADLDGDDRPEVLFTARHHRFYPCELLVYWPEAGRWDWVLDHSGWIIAITPVPDATSPELAFLALNNRLLALPVVGRLRLQPPGRRFASIANQSPVVAPGYHLHTSRVATLEQYTLLPSEFASWAAGSDSASMTLAPEGGLRLEWGPSTIDLDRYGNPDGGPNSGRNLTEARLTFLQDVEFLRSEVRLSTRAEVTAVSAGILRRYPDLIDEAPYAAVSGVLRARALAHGGDPEAAAAVLRETLTQAPMNDVVVNLAQVSAVAGDRGEAARLLLPLREKELTPQVAYDVPHLLLRLATEDRDSTAVRRWTEALVSQETSPDRRAVFAAALTGRVRLWWDQSALVDTEAQSQSFAPDGDAVASLARWRLGRSLPDDVERTRSAIAQWPDAEREGRAAMAAAQLARGLPADAVAGLDRLVADLEAPAREDFAAHQLLDLVRGLRAQALLAADRLPEARAEAEALVASATPGLLPANLAREVLERTGSR